MLTKLKWLKTYWTRDILPAAGVTIGKILYTGKNTTGKRTQYVFDLDTQVATKQKIDASPADPKTQPNKVVEYTTIAPKTDTSLYLFNSNVKPVITGTHDASFTQTIANGAAITAVNVLTGVKINNVAATVLTAKITKGVETGLVLDVATGAVTLTDNTTAGTYTVTYTVADINEPTVKYEDVISITVEEA